MSTLITLIAAAVSMLALVIVASGILVLSIKRLKQALGESLTLPAAHAYKAGHGRMKAMPRVA